MVEAVYRVISCMKNGKAVWERVCGKAKDKYLASSAIVEADKIHTPLLIWHNDKDEAVAYEQGRALYLAMRRFTTSGMAS